MSGRQQCINLNQNRSGGKEKTGTKTRNQRFFPNSPTSVGSPIDDGARFYQRLVRQRTPNKLCSLALPPPLTSFFDKGGESADGAIAAPASRVASSSDASLDGNSHVESANAPPVPSGARHSSNASAISASAVSAGGVGSSGSSVRRNPRLPPHLRVGMAPCDPLLAFRGKYALVATSDGRIAIYSLLDFGCEVMSEDVELSEQRRLVEISGEIMENSGLKKNGEENDDQTKTRTREQRSDEIIGPSSTEKETESEWLMRDRMHRRERAKEKVEPILTFNLPKQDRGMEDDCNKKNISTGTGSFDEESAVDVGIRTAPLTIVGMCATPGIGSSLIDQTDALNASATLFAENRAESPNTCYQPLLPTFGKDLLGHVAVLTHNGEVHVLEFLHTPSPISDFHGSVNIPKVNVVVSFRTGHFGATCICMHRHPFFAKKGSGISRQALSIEDSAHGAHQRIRLCIGHKSGVIASFQIHSTCSFPKIQKVHPSPKESMGEVTSRGASPQEEDSGTGPPVGTVIQDLAVSHARSKSTDFEVTESSNMQSSPGKAAPHVLFHRNEIHIPGKSDDFQTVHLHRTLSDPITGPNAGECETAKNGGPAQVSLSWQGGFDMPICSLSSPGWGRRSETGTQMEECFLAVGQEQRQYIGATQDAMNAHIFSMPHYYLSPAISLEMINVSLALKKWCQNRDGPNSSNCISLNDCCVWAIPGREIKDGWLRAQLSRGIDPGDEVFRMMGTQRFSVTNKLCCFEGHGPCFATASSDGTVAIAHYQPEDGTWGVMTHDNQLTFFQRSIGLAPIDHYDTASEARRYVACCLRGGTIYLVPISELRDGELALAANQNEVTMFVPPSDPDGEDDGSVRFVQNFTAGAAQVMAWTDQRDMFRSHLIARVSDDALRSVALVGWNGGNIDVYGITPRKTGR